MSEHAMPEGPEPPPPGTAAMGLVRWAILAIAALVALGSLRALARADHPSVDAGSTRSHAWKYHCPMHRTLQMYW